MTSHNSIGEATLTQTEVGPSPVRPPGGRENVQYSNKGPSQTHNPGSTGPRPRILQWHRPRIHIVGTMYQHGTVTELQTEEGGPQPTAIGYQKTIDSSSSPIPSQRSHHQPYLLHPFPFTPSPQPRLTTSSQAHVVSTEPYVRVVQQNTVTPPLLLHPPTNARSPQRFTTRTIRLGPGRAATRCPNACGVAPGPRGRGEEGAGRMLRCAMRLGLRWVAGWLMVDG